MRVRLLPQPFIITQIIAIASIRIYTLMLYTNNCHAKYVDRNSRAIGYNSHRRWAQRTTMKNEEAKNLERKGSYRARYGDLSSHVLACISYH